MTSPANPTRSAETCSAPPANPLGPEAPRPSGPAANRRGYWPLVLLVFLGGGMGWHALRELTEINQAYDHMVQVMQRALF